MSYSTDLREKVIQYVESKNSITQAVNEASELFNISSRTIYNWMKKKKTTGTLRDKKPNRPWKKLDPDALCQFVKEHPDWTLKEYASHFNSIPSTICEAFKRLRITRKKRPHSTEKEMKQNEKYFWKK